MEEVVEGKDYRWAVIYNSLWQQIPMFTVTYKCATNVHDGVAGQVMGFSTVGAAAAVASSMAAAQLLHVIRHCGT